MKINFIRHKLMILVLLAWAAFIAIPSNVHAAESARYFYKQLDTTCQGIYDEILAAIDKSNFDSDGLSVTLSGENLDITQVSLAAKALDGDCAEFVLSNATYSDSYIKSYFTAAYWQEAMNAVDSINQSLNINESDSRVNKIHTIHDYIVSHVNYGSLNTTINQGQTFIGAVLPQFGYEAVCAGYAKLFQMLCLKNNIPCLYLSGCSDYFEGKSYGGHAWNMIQLENGSWYYVDCTFDDPLGNTTNENSEESSYYHKYLFYAKDMISLQNDLRSPVDTLQYFTLPDLSEKSIHVISNFDIDYDSSDNPFPDVRYSYDYTYDRVVNGNALLSKSTLKSVQLVENEDYTLTTISDPKNHKYTFTVNGIGNCIGSVTKTIQTDHDWSSWKILKNATVFSEGSKTRSCSICSAQVTKTIKKLTPTIKLSRSKVTLNRKSKKNRSAVIKVSNLAKGDSVVSWKSTKKNVASVNKKGKIVAKKKGKTNIIVTLASGKQAVVKVTVK